MHEHRDDVRLMLQITSPRRAADKLKFLAGSEAAKGAWIGDVAPEAAAEALRTAIAAAASDETSAATPTAANAKTTTTDAAASAPASETEGPRA
ncbi:hypothetical protein GCM10009717_10940 [Agromyces allii]|uniref:Uncharacterized protein n=1 Tax=Agromyces allii TaxID=393607 RepID=A0ABP5BK70_9MICO